MEVFKCHKNLQVTCYICTKCYSLFHKRCSKRDWQGRLIHIDGHKVLCCTDKVEEDNVEVLNGKIEELKHIKDSMELQMEKLLHEKEMLFREYEESEMLLQREILTQKQEIKELKISQEVRRIILRPNTGGRMCLPYTIYRKQELLKEVNKINGTDKLQSVSNEDSVENVRVSVNRGIQVKTHKLTGPHEATQTGNRGNDVKSAMKNQSEGQKKNIVKNKSTRTTRKDIKRNKEWKAKENKKQDGIVDCCCSEETNRDSRGLEQESGVLGNELTYNSTQKANKKNKIKIIGDEGARNFRSTLRMLLDEDRFEVPALIWGNIEAADLSREIFKESIDHGPNDYIVFMFETAN
ncbi:hypothetical protein HHI36_003046, partial [Cryptolaemus montrouzieri]